MVATWLSGQALLMMVTTSTVGQGVPSEPSTATVYAFTAERVREGQTAEDVFTTRAVGVV
jgi:hypothetical protein